MPLIYFKKSEKHLLVEHGANLMKALQENHIPIASSCGGDAVCAKCQVEIIKGLENLSPENIFEKRLKEANNIPEKIRISCQVSVRGDIEIDTSYW